MGKPKGLLRTADGTPWVSRAVVALTDGGCRPVLVVTGAESSQVRALVPASAGVLVAADWSEGLGASLRAGLGAVQKQAAQQQAPSAVAAIITLVDTLGVTPEVVARLHRLAEPTALARTAYAGAPGHPVLIGREHWAGVIETAIGDAGARHYLAARDVHLVECADVGSGDDLDTPEDLHRWTESELMDGTGPDGRNRG